MSRQSIGIGNLASETPNGNISCLLWVKHTKNSNPKFQRRMPPDFATVPQVRGALQCYFQQHVFVEREQCDLQTSDAEFLLDFFAGGAWDIAVQMMGITLTPIWWMRLALNKRKGHDAWMVPS